MNKDDLQKLSELLEQFGEFYSVPEAIPLQERVEAQIVKIKLEDRR